MMPNPLNANHPTIYQIRIQGHLSHLRARSFEGMTITLDDSGDTLLTGPIADQAALHGLIKNIRDLGIPLLSVNRVEPEASDDPGRDEQA
jgi:hypothetical protein